MKKATHNPPSVRKTQKAFYRIDFTHNEDTFMSLAHMQYDLFCRKNHTARTLIAIACLSVGVVYMEHWWAYLLIAYGVFLATGKYNQSNHTARKLIKGIKAAGLPFPSSQYIFENDRMRVISRLDGEELPCLMYADVKRLGKDRDYYYLFRDEHGGYMIPKASLDQKEDEFTAFLKDRTGQIFFTKRTPPYKKFIQDMKLRGYWPMR